MKKIYDVIVIGIGSMGSAACYYAASKGATVLGLDQFSVPNQRSSHAGYSRIIRMAYFEHPNYVPLLQHAYRNWATIEKESNQDLFHKTGLIYFGKEDSQLIQGVRNSASKYNLNIHELTVQESNKSYPQFNIPSSYERILEPNAGFLNPSKCIQTYKELAIKVGCEIQEQTSVKSYTIKGDLIEVKTDKENFQARHLILTNGSWTSQLNQNLKPLLKVSRQSYFWFEPKDPNAFLSNVFPCFNIEDEQAGLLYGFPYQKKSETQAAYGWKVSQHVHGLSSDPNALDREIKQAEIDEIIALLEAYIPNGFGKFLDGGVCMYTNSPDEDFILGHLPDSNQKISIACGFSGHGFKFASAIGEILAELSLEKKTSAPIDFLSPDRFS